MCSLITSFFIISPLLIAYASGYRYDFEKHKIKQTGILNIDILPRDAQIFLNNKLVDQKIPFNTSLHPDTYLLTIKKNGYKTWEKNISINSTKTTYVNYIQLVKDEKPQDLNINNVRSFLSNIDSKNALIIQDENNLQKISTFNFLEKKVDLIENDVNITNYSISPYQNFVYITKEKSGEKQLEFFDLDKLNKNFIIDLNTSTENHHIQWLDNENYLAIVKDNNQLKFIKTNGEIKILEKNIIATENWYSDHKNNIWLYNENILFFEKENYIVNSQITEIIYIDEHLVIGKTTNEFFLIDRKTQKIENIKAEKYFFDQKNQQWVVYSDWEIFTIKKDANVNLEYRNGEKIKNLLLAENHNYILSTENKVTILDTNRLTEFDILDNPQNNIYLNQKQRELFFISSPNNNLYLLNF